MIYFAFLKIVLAIETSIQKISYDDVGYIPPKIDYSARGGSMIRSYDDYLLIWNPETEEIIVFNDIETVHDIQYMFVMQIQGEGGMATLMSFSLC